MSQTIHIRGARTHNLQGIDLELPRDRLIVFTGLSGSGKSSLAFDTIYAEGQRRYVESLSAYARQFLSMMEKPDVDTIEGLSPAISIEQKSTSHNPRSTVGTVTEIYDYLRLLYARAGIPRCPDHGLDLTAQTVSQMVDQVMALPEGTAVALIAPIISGRKGEHLQVVEELRSKGFVRARIDGKYLELEAAPKLDPKKKHSIDAVIDRLKVRPDLQQRLAESFETALRLGEGSARVAFLDEPKREELVFSDKFACRICGYSVSELEPRLFSFNNPFGACPGCDGLGVKQFFDPDRVVTNGQLSLANGAVRGWDRRNAYYFQMIQALADHYKFDPEAPYANLPPRAREVLMQGSGGEEVEFRYFDSRGRTVRRKHKFEGILPNLERRYHETESLAVREELARYLGTRRCPECDGARLTKAARFVFVGGTSLPTISALPVRRALEFFNVLVARGLAPEDRGEDRQGDHRPPRLPRGRRPRLPDARPQRRDALRRRGAAHPPREPDRLRPRRRHVHPRRALDRPAPARQPAPARHAASPPGPRQHGHRRRARRGRDPAGGPRRGPRARRRRARRARRRPGHAGADRGESRLAHGSVPLGPQAHRDPGKAAQERAEATAETAQGERQQPEADRRVIPGRDS